MMETVFSRCSLQAYLPSRDITVTDVTLIDRMWDNTWQVRGKDAVTGITASYRDKDVIINLVDEK